jgi:hypothetical protein
MTRVVLLLVTSYLTAECDYSQLYDYDVQIWLKNFSLRRCLENNERSAKQAQKSHVMSYTQQLFYISDTMV